MTRNEYRAWLRTLQGEELRMAERASSEYASDADALSNFKSASTYAGVPIEAVLLTYMSKHMDGIASWVGGNRDQRDTLRGRIFDLRAYLALLLAAVEEKEAPAAVKPATVRVSVNASDALKSVAREWLMTTVSNVRAKRIAEQEAQLELAASNLLSEMLSPRCGGHPHICGLSEHVTKNGNRMLKVTLVKPHMGNHARWPLIHIRMDDTIKRLGLRRPNATEILNATIDADEFDSIWAISQSVDTYLLVPNEWKPL